MVTARRWVMASLGLLLATVAVVHFGRAQLAVLRTGGLRPMTVDEIRVADFDLVAFRRWGFVGTFPSPAGGSDTIDFGAATAGAGLRFSLAGHPGDLSVCGELSADGRLWGGPDLKDIGNQRIELIVARFHGPGLVNGVPSIYADIRSLPADPPDPTSDPKLRVLRTWRGVLRAVVRTDN
jgi:hypothetical protein